MMDKKPPYRMAPLQRVLGEPVTRPEEIQAINEVVRRQRKQPGTQEAARLLELYQDLNPDEQVAFLGALLDGLSSASLRCLEQELSLRLARSTAAADGSHSA